MISLFKKIKYWTKKTFCKPPYIQFRSGDILATKKFWDVGCYLGENSRGPYIAAKPYDYSGMPYYGGTHLPEGIAIWYKIGHIDVPDTDDISEKYKVWRKFAFGKNHEDIISYFNLR